MGAAEQVVELRAERLLQARAHLRQPGAGLAGAEDDLDPELGVGRPSTFGTCSAR